MRLPPSLLALRFKAHQNWPGNIEPWNNADESFRVTTLETPSEDGVMRRIGSGLAIQDVVFPDSALNNIDWEAWSAAERDSLAASLETVEIRRNGRWMKIRYPGTWMQRLKP